MDILQLFLRSGIENTLWNITRDFISEGIRSNVFFANQALLQNFYLLWQIRYYIRWIYFACYDHRCNRGTNSNKISIIIPLGEHCLHLIEIFHKDILTIKYPPSHYGIFCIFKWIFLFSIEFKKNADTLFWDLGLSRIKSGMDEIRPSDSSNRVFVLQEIGSP